MTKTICITLLACFSFLCIEAQVFDDFSDNNFTQNPAWIGDDSLFQATTGQLRLKANASGEACLVTPFPYSDSVQWQFFTRLNLNPSSQNFSRFYLLSNNSNLKGPVSGYFIQFGGSTGTTDTLILCKQTGLEIQKILYARPATCGKNNNLISIKVFRNHTGIWHLYTDTSGGNNFYYEGAVLDSSHTTNQYVGWYIKYTASNAQNHYLDAVNINRVFADTVGPTIDSVVVVDSTTIELAFNEAIHAQNSLNPFNFSIHNNTVRSVALKTSTKLAVTFNTPFENKKFVTITAKNIADTIGNLMPDTAFTFVYYKPALHDVLIAEFFPDPSPSVGLPEYEFIEIYNASGITINLNNYIISDGKTEATLPSVVLAPAELLLLCDDSDTAYFNEYGKIIGLSQFPTLNNDADSLILLSPNKTILHSLYYQNTWYKNNAKANGGYSIELNRPNQLCKGEAVFSASTHPQGGTPGNINSVWDTLPDVASPAVEKAGNISPNLVAFKTNENIDTTLLKLSDITFTPNWFIHRLSFIKPDSIVAFSNDSLLNKTTYSIAINNLVDCALNSAAEQINIQAIYAEREQFCDVVINEIMCNPTGANNLPEVEYIELYNRSNRVINLHEWVVADATSQAKLPNRLLLPDSFVVFYPASAQQPGSITGFPILGNEADVVTLKNNLSQVIHSVQYNTTLYNQPIKQLGGWSLELINPNNPCSNNSFNFCVNSYGGTPGLKNSIHSNQSDTLNITILKAGVVDSLNLFVLFNKTIDSSHIHASQILVNNAPAKNYTWLAPAYQQLNILLANPLEENNLYQLTITNAKGCVGDESTTTYHIPFASKPGKSDIVINEVLFNPKSNAYDFVELYNLTDKYLTLNRLYIANLNEQNLPDEICPINQDGYVLYPKSHIVLTQSASALINQYECKYPVHIIETKLPTLPDNEGHVIVGNDAFVFDEFAYNQNMHFALIDEQEGVSLERINALASTQQASNWTSAASTVGYATPTYTNSQNRIEKTSTKSLSVSPKRCSPDGDGFEDVLNILYTLPDIGYTATISIFNDQGVLVAKPVVNQLMPQTGEIYWDGVTQNQTKAPIGIYVVYIEAYNLNGNVIKDKAGFAVVAK